MNNVLTILLFLLVPCSITFAQYSTDIANGNVNIISYTGRASSVNIPEQINGKPVTAIGRAAFFHKGISSVVMPSTVTSIGTQSFDNNNLNVITLPNNITLFGEMAFGPNRNIVDTYIINGRQGGTFTFSNNVWSLNTEHFFIFKKT